ncbi:translocation/assembly module TamB domain-containing protein [Lysobacter solisilvae]|uniref:Translocation/assembly module TamB domain-containing protein n=2 Tax=Agrilutibacter solisilvae TaxID=2763317 RepID=A0A974Y0M8_9GAMM|nr:translocation/assembly module TamB domain-containing protein [Lysobacter solisilvae]QSX79232.1 translocation/assembly module TamB domain-containing protein [Lysobacter solisilvae]
MPTVPSTPADVHEARIAQLRARRRARMRWLAVRSGIGLAAVLVLGSVFLYWLLTSIGGRELLLSQIQQRLPATARLTWTRAEGPASGPLVLHGVRFTYEMTDKDGRRDPAHPRLLVFSARRVMLDPALRPLLGRRLRLDGLEVAGATLEVPESDEPFELPRWPESLPDIRPPLALQADDVRVDGLRITSERVPVINITTLRGGIDAQAGLLHVEHLGAVTDRGVFALHGDYAPRDDFRMDLVATAVLPAPAGHTQPRLGLVARGDLASLRVALGGRVPAPLRADIALAGGERPRWTLNADTSALDLDLLLRGKPGPTPWSGRVRAQGVGGVASLQGEVARGDLVVSVLPSKLRLENQVLEARPLALRLLGGTLTARGRADFTPADKRAAFADPDQATMHFAVNARGLTWGGAATTPSSPSQAATGTPQVTADADLGVAGTVRAWAAIGRATITRDTEQARLTLDGRGDLEHMDLRDLHVAMPAGTLDGRGEIRWAPALGWDLTATLAGFDPGYFAPDWNGALRGTLASQGRTRADGGLDLAVDAPRIDGQLRGRPLQARARLRMLGAPAAKAQAVARYEGDVAMTLGASHVEAKGTIADTLDIDARFLPLQLGDLLPQGAGTLRGQLKLSGARTAPDIDADLDGSGLRYGAWRAETLHAQGRLPWRQGDGALRVAATGLDLGTPVDTLDVQARGAVEDLRLEATARGDIGTLALAGDAHRRGATWEGTLASLRLQPARGATWQLQQASRFRWDGRNGALSQACLASDGGGTLCANADWPRRGLDVRGQGLPLTLLLPYLPERNDSRPWLLRGQVDVEGQLRPAGNAWRGQARLTSAGGGIRNSERSRSEFVRYGNLELTATFDPQRLSAQLSSTLNDDGRIDARISTGWDAYAPLSGEIALNTDEITWLELFSPDIVEPRGKLSGDIRLGGTRAQPMLGGNAHLSEFTTELPALAITVQQGDLRMVAQPDGSARITGSLRSGEGTLAVDGSLGWRGTDTPLVLALRGQDVLVSDTRDLHAVANPDVQLRYTAGQPFQITGTVTVPEARIDLERLDEGVSTSPDVVVLDPADPEYTASTPLDMDLTLALGDAVALSGFGLDGMLSGRLRVRARPGREMTAAGQLDVEGRYRAYGQKLEITRGELVWSNGPVADPILNIRAEREVGDVTAGVDVRGRASAPQARVWSNPESSQSEALALLALGRPLSSISGDESRQLNAASAALSAGGSLLASQLGARIGLDEAGVMESRALGGSVLGIGKFLSPRLYVGYGVSLLGTGQVLTLKYLLRKGFDIEIESSTVENRASVNWRKEK